MERFHYPHVLSLPLTPHASLTPKHLSLSLPPLSHHNLSVDEVTECEQKKTAETERETLLCKRSRTGNVRTVNM